MIPGSRVSPIAKGLVDFIPLPNQPGQVDGNQNYIDSSTRRDVFDGEFGRLDYNISDRHKFFYSFRHNYRVEDRNNHYHNIATGNLLNRINWGSTVDDVYTFSPTDGVEHPAQLDALYGSQRQAECRLRFHQARVPGLHRGGLAAAGDADRGPEPVQRLGRQCRRSHAVRQLPAFRHPHQVHGSIR